MTMGICSYVRSITSCLWLSTIVILCIKDSVITPCNFRRADLPWPRRCSRSPQRGRHTHRHTHTHTHTQIQRHTHKRANTHVTLGKGFGTFGPCASLSSYGDLFGVTSKGITTESIIDPCWIPSLDWLWSVYLQRKSLFK